MNSLIPDAVKESTNLTPIAAATAATAIICCWLATTGIKYRRGHNGRRWSCMSESMAFGSFPPKTKFEEPIINVVMMFDGDDRPSVDEVVEHCVKVLLKYERFSSVFDRTVGLAFLQLRQNGKESQSINIDPRDLVRVVPVKDCFSDNDILKKIESQACVPLAQAPRGTLLPWWEFVILDNDNSKGRSAVLWRLHHSL